MNAPPILQRHPALRWLAPVGVLGVAALAATGMFSASASPESLPRTTPTALLAAVQRTNVSGFAGTVVSHLSLGLPELPAIGNTGDGTSFTSLLSGSHTLQVWYGGPTNERIALLGSTDETDVFRAGSDVWQWSSANKTAVHTVLPAGMEKALSRAPVPTSTATMTPVDVAHQALGALQPSTRVSVQTGHAVADRSTYDLVLTPRTSATKVGSVHISVDGATKVPLGVQIYPRGSTSPSVDVAFTSIAFGHQSHRNFEFTPPPGAKVRQGDTESSSPRASTLRTEPTVTTHGSGWATVVTVRPGKQATSSLLNPALRAALTTVSGSWGSGHLLESDLVSALVTDDGRVVVGAVEPAQLYAAAGTK